MKFPLELFIENTRVDFFDDESLTIKKGIKDTSKPDKIVTDFSRHFTVPASKTNNKIFKHYYNAHITNGIDARTLLNATLNLKGELYRTGTINVEEVQMRNGKAFAYKVFFLGSLSKIKRAIGEDYLTDLGLTDLDIINPNYETLFSNAGVTDVIKFPLISKGTRFLTHSTDKEIAVDIDGAKNISFIDNATDHDNYGILASDLAPVLRVSELLDKIEDRYGLTFTGVFKDAIYIRNLHLVLQKKKQKATGGGATPEAYSIAGFQTSSNTDYTINSNNVTFAPKTSYSYFYQMVITITTLLTNYQIRTYKNGVLDIILNETYTSYGYIFVQGEGSPNVYTWELETVQEGTVEIDFSINKRASYQGGLLSSKSFTGFANTALDTGVFVVSKHIPKMKVKDFLTSLFKQFNIVATVDKDLNVDTKHYDHFLSTGTTHEIDKYVDKTRSTVSRPNAYSGMAFTYKEEKTILEQGYLQVNGKKYGEIEYFITSATSNHLSGEAFKTEIPLQRIPCEQTTDLDDGTASGVQYMLLGDDKGKEQQCAPILTYLAMRAVGANIAYNTGTTVSNIANYWIPVNTYAGSAVGSSTAYVGNYFGDEIDEFHLDTRFEGLGFFNLFWYGITQLMFEPDKRRVTYEAQLPLRILRTLSLADRLIISGDLHVIESVETNYLSGKSKLSLIRIKPEDLEDFQQNTTTITPGSNPTHVNYIGTDGLVKYQAITSATAITHIGKIKRQYNG